MKSTLLAAMLGLSRGIGVLNPEPSSHFATNGKRRRKIDYFRNDVKDHHKGYPGAKLARKALLGEVGTARPQ